MRKNYVLINLTTLLLFTSIVAFSQKIVTERSEIKPKSIEQRAVADTVISDNLIVIGKGCVGSGCADNEDISGTTILKLKQSDSPTLRLEQDGTVYPLSVWDIGANETNFLIRDVTGGGTLPFKINPGSVDNAFVISGTNVYLKGAVLPAASLPSDRRLKQNIAIFTNAGDLLSRLTPKTFDYDLTAFPNYGFPVGVQYGLIAQEVEKVLPDYVTEVSFPNGKRFKTVNYIGLIPILLQSYKEQQAEIERLKEENLKYKQLEERFAVIEAKLESAVFTTLHKSNSK